MERELDMQILPSFCDEECAIVFSFQFKARQQKIGEAVIYTCSGEQQDQDTKQLSSGYTLRTEYTEGFPVNNIAYIREFSVMEEYKQKSYRDLLDFLKVIGIKDCIYEAGSWIGELQALAEG
ncbi:hypothetical protein ACQCVH_10740 [Bacillus infantis]|uniref:hypothetical protein n=1 Tax=Bacillus infantis TaxID=324767 RepID=UPI003CF7E79C